MYHSVKHCDTFLYYKIKKWIKIPQFDLNSRDGRDGGPDPDRAQVSRVWTDDEQIEKLNGYLEIPPEFWDQIKYTTHMQYYTKTDGYRPGGFVLRNPFDVKQKGIVEEKRFIKLQNGFSDKARGYCQWIVAYEDIEKIYVKPDAQSLTLMRRLETMGTVKGLNKNIRKIAEHCKRFEAPDC